MTIILRPPKHLLAKLRRSTLRRIRFRQHIPDGREPLFQIVERVPGDNYWHARIADAIIGDEPEFICRIPKKSNYPLPQPIDVACKAAGECNEGRGLVTLRRYQDGIPVYCGWFASNGSQVFEIDPRTMRPIRQPKAAKGAA